MPWRHKVAAILVLFLGGQESGSAWGDVLFGDMSPQGRLPLMIPATEQDIIETEPGMRVLYSEGMATSYRNKKLKAAFPFGHGLSYSRFDYPKGPELGKCGHPGSGEFLGMGTQPGEYVCLCQQVQNIGNVSARTTVQLYLELSSESKQPAALLKGFFKTGLLSKDSVENVTFCLNRRDVSYYDSSSDAWVIAHRAIAHIGESSADIRHRLAVLPLKKRPPPKRKRLLYHHHVPQSSPVTRGVSSAGIYGLTAVLGVVLLLTCSWSSYSRSKSHTQIGLLAE